MFWDGYRWLDEEPKPTKRNLARKPGAFLAILAAGFLAFTLLPLSSGSAEATGGTALISQWASTGSEQTIQDASSRVTYSGRWFEANATGYLGGTVRSTNQASASVTLSFTGTGIAWIGPKGPTRGSARVYVDGHLASTISSYDSAFRPAQELFQSVWDSAAAHTIKLVAAGTKGHPTVALDAFVVRGTVSTAVANRPRPHPSKRPSPSAPAATVPAPRPSGSSTSQQSPSPAVSPAPPSSPTPTAAPTSTPAPTMTPAPTPAPTATPAPTPAPTATPAPTPAPTATPAPTPAPTATPTPTPAPTQAPAGKSVRVTSIAGLLAQLADNTVTEIVVANGTYVVPDAATHQTTGLWIDGRFASRTNPVVVRADTLGGVTFSGGGATGWSALDFRDGAHDQTWQGFSFANGEPTQTGVIVFGQNGSVTPSAVRNITLRDLTVQETVTSDNPSGMCGDHAVYFSSSLTPNTGILIERLTVHASTSGLDSALHFYTQPALGPGPQNVTVRGLAVDGTDQAVVFWDASLSGITLENSTITGAKAIAVRYELGGRVTLSGVTSVNSASHGFYSTLGTSPASVTFLNDSLH